MGLRMSCGFNVKKSEEQPDQILTISEESQELSLAQLTLPTPAPRRVCSYCGMVAASTTRCTNCDQISYCSPACRLADSARHRAFCNLSLTDLF